MPRVKKILLWVLVAFAVYAIFTSPDQAADIVETSGGIARNGVENIGNFFDALLGRERTRARWPPQPGPRELDRYLLEGERSSRPSTGTGARSPSRSLGRRRTASSRSGPTPGSTPRWALVSTIVWWPGSPWSARAVWKLVEWRHDWFVATDKRLLLFYGFITRKVAMMPLTKVTDMSYNRSVPGRILGYGRFVLESAGQDQALRVVTWVPEPDQRYRAICAEIFGVTARGGTTPDDNGQPTDGTRWDDTQPPPTGYPNRTGWDDRDIPGTRHGLPRSAKRAPLPPPRPPARDRSADTGPIPSGHAATGATTRRGHQATQKDLRRAEFRKARWSGRR